MTGDDLDIYANVTETHTRANTLTINRSNKINFFNDNFNKVIKGIR